MPSLERARDFALEPALRAHLLLTLGRVMEHARDYEAAVEYYRQGEDVHGAELEDRYWLLNNLAYCLSRLEQDMEALYLCRAAIDCDPERHNAYKNHGVALEALGHWDQAADAYLKAADIAPEDRRSWMHLKQLLAAHPEVLRIHALRKERVEACRAADAEVRRELH